ncbi:PspC domain-containing protein [Caenibacillus caldisaponilyticus]|jgi:phage shock protein C|uniref:PspC domain-containing protein n=1 Tax=Caenibacillus caldisaponilyticus TaxID=1674942 RepID=UPI0009887D3D|nr:PspC domain-containing protein [Caenibacillus caldisaponilyticus]
MKKLYRSRNNRMLAGILGGIGEYLDVDPTVVRVVYLILLILTAVFPLVLIYLALYFIIPASEYDG